MFFTFAPTQTNKTIMNITAAQYTSIPVSHTYQSMPLELAIGKVTEVGEAAIPQSIHESFEIDDNDFNVVLNHESGGIFFVSVGRLKGFESSSGVKLTVAKDGKMVLRPDVYLARKKGLAAVWSDKV